LWGGGLLETIRKWKNLSRRTTPSRKRTFKKKKKKNRPSKKKVSAEWEKMRFA